MDPILAPKVKLNNGYEMPAMGLGSSTAYDDGYNVGMAIDEGFRLIEATYFNENENVVGNEIRNKINEGVINREDIFIVFNLWRHAHEPERVENACRKSLERLGLDYIDCYTIDCPFSYVYRDDDAYVSLNARGEIDYGDVDYLDTWKAMEALVEKGLVKSIGVSNFNSEQLLRLLANCKIKPVLNNVECHPGLSQKPLIALCKQHDIVVTGYKPFGRNERNKSHSVYLFNNEIMDIGFKHGKTTLQIVLRYLIELGVVPFVSEFYDPGIDAFLNIFNFSLSLEDRKVMDKFNIGDRLTIFWHAKNHKYYPFKIPY